MGRAVERGIDNARSKRGGIETGSSLLSGDAREASERFFDFFSVDPAADDPLLLRRLIAAFSRIPYENLSKIIKQTETGSAPRFRLPPEVLQDHIEHRLGGTCFSLTHFFQKILTAAGFEAYRVMAHMRAGRNIHCAVVVCLPEGRVLIDPGYGLNRPVPLRTDAPVRFASRHGGVELRYDADTDEYHLFTYMARERKWRYCFADRPVPDDEFERHWIDSFSKPSLHQICLYRASPQGHLYLRKHHLRLTTFRGQQKENVRETLHKTVKDYFGISPVWVDRAREVLEERKAGRSPDPAP